MRRWFYCFLLAVVMTMWGVGVWKEHRMEKEGKEVIGRVVAGDWKGKKRPAFTVEFSTESGPIQKEFTMGPSDAARITGGTDEFIHPEVRIRYHEEFPDIARLAENTPLPWWVGLIGMCVTMAFLAFALTLPPKNR
jgi:hypothetical protein